MPTFCLLPAIVNKFKEALRSGELDPAKLAEMTSEKRREAISKYVGEENSHQVNALFESKLLLKNQKAGYISWAKSVAGISKEVRRDLISKIERLDKALSGKEKDLFLEDLAKTRLGLDVTELEMKKIFEMTDKLTELKKNQDPKTLKFPSEEERLQYGAAKVALYNFTNGIKEETNKLTLTDRINPANYVQNVSEVAGLAKSLKASLDNSAIFRQGWKALWTNPIIWQRNARKSFVDIAKTMSGTEVMDGIMADIVSRPNYERMQKAKLAIGTIEESFPMSLPEKIPFLGRIYKASETAYTGFIYRTRADIFDAYIGIAEQSGVNINDKVELSSIGKLVNTLTGRSDLGSLEKSASAVNNIFFSPRNLASQFDFLTAHARDPKFTGFARKQAAINIVKVILGTAAILAIAKALNPDSVETDPRSSDFGKIKVGNTRFDVSGGMSSIVTLASRIIMQSTKSTSTGIVNELNTGNYGSQTTKDVLYNFIENKLSPAAAIIKDMMVGKDFDGNPITVTGELKNLFMPLPISNYEELKKDPKAAPIVLAILADALGIATNNYGQTEKNWDNNTSKKLLKFKEKVGEEKFNAANDAYNKSYNEWYIKTSKKEEFKKLSDEDKKQILSDAKGKMEDKILKEYGFRYRERKTINERIQNRKNKRLLPR